jgi:hypothetical protein
MRTRTIPETVEVPVQLADGRVRMGRQTQQRQVPRLPRDWDHIILGSVTVGALAFLTVSVVWTAASVGDLLAQAVTEWIAYTVAAGFDLVWIMCLGLEWVARHDRDRAAAPRKAGVVFLLISMAAVGVHGWQTKPAVGIIGALVAALAKGLWVVVLHYRAVDLPEPVRDVLARERAELGLELALAQHQRQALRTRSQLAAYRAAIAVPEPDADVEVVQEPRREAGGRAEGTVRAAIQAARSTLPGADPAAIVAQLAHAGITVDEDTVRAVVGPPPGGDADDAHHDALQASGLSKTAAIVEAASLMRDDAPAAEVADLVQQRHGLAVEENYVRTVLSRASRKPRPGGVGQGGGGYA